MLSVPGIPQIKFCSSIRSMTALLCLILCGLLLPVNCPAARPLDDTHNWKVYTNVRFSYSICYPEDLLVPQGESPNSDGQKFISADGAVLLVYGSNNAMGESINQIRQRAASRLAGTDGKITYTAGKIDWYVISGLNGDSVFYAKAFVSKDRSRSFELVYNSSLSRVYAPVLSRISACFVRTNP